MITSLNDVQLGLRQGGTNGAQEIQVGKVITGTLKKQHGKSDIGEMLCPGSTRPPGRVEWKPKEDNSANPLHRL